MLPHQSLDIESIKLGKIDKKRITKKYAQYRSFYILLKYEDLHGACREREIVLDDYEKYEEKENGETREARKSIDQKFSSILLSSIPQRPTNQEIQENTAPNLMVDIKDSLATQSNVKLDKAFSLENIEDKRKRTTASIVQRSGQSKFRQSLLEAYNGRCAITGCDVEEALDAAHIHPYSGSESDRVSNGLLLRADLHKLFDCYLLAIDPTTMEVHIAPSLANSYGELAGKRLNLPEEQALTPNRKVLEGHFAQCKWIND
jgi:predicted restriction endonuclease